MPKGPKGEKHPADVVSAAVKVMRIATGEIEAQSNLPVGQPLASESRSHRRRSLLFRHNAVEF